MKTSPFHRAPALTLAAVLGWLSACKPAPSTGAAAPSPRGAEAIPVTIARVEVLPLDRTIPVVGTLFPKDEAIVSAEVEGRVEKTFFDMGDDVPDGAPLVAIDTASHDAAARRSAANLAKAQASAAEAELTLKREQELQRQGIASTSQYDGAEAAAKQWRAEVRSAEAADATARLNLTRSTVQAPFAGAVAERLVSAGDFVKVGTPLYRLVNDRTLKFITQVPERHAAEVRKEQPVRLTVDAFPDAPFVGRVYLISPAVNTTTRAFPLGALVPNADRRLKSSSFARGELLLAEGVPTLLVPLEAVGSFAGVTKVFVLEDGVAKARPIEVGRVRDGRQEVRAGLAAGDQVITSGQTRLFDGAKVRLQQP